MNIEDHKCDHDWVDVFDEIDDPVRVERCSKCGLGNVRDTRIEQHLVLGKYVSGNGRTGD